jgi:NitT/TauT family transport system substrate-binding protein
MAAGRRPHAFSIPFAIALFAALTVVSSMSARTASAQTLTTIHVGTTGRETDAQVFYAQDLGYFKKAGLDVDIQILANGAAIAGAVAAGSLNVGDSNVITIANAHVRGLPFIFIAGGGLYTSSTPTTLMGVALNGSVHSPKDLNGKVVAGVSLRGLDETAARAYIDQGGGDNNSVKYVELPMTEMPAALDSGRIDGAVLTEPVLGAVRSKVRILGKVYDGVGKQFMNAAWFSTTDWLAKNPAAAKSFADVMVQAAVWANANHDKAAAILEKYTKLQTDPAQHTFITFAQSLDPGMLQSVIDSGVKYKTVSHGFPASEIIWSK